MNFGWHVLDTHLQTHQPLPAAYQAHPCPSAFCGLERREVGADAWADSGDLTQGGRTAVNAWALADCRDLAFHAGVVAAGSWAAAFPASSGAGKSVLTAAALLLAGRYVSDEALVVEESTGRIRPYPKPINLDRAGLGLLGLPTSTSDDRKTGLDPRSIGAACTPDERLSLAAVVLLDRRATGPALLGDVSEADAAERLLRLSFNHYRQPIAAVRTVSALARQSRCVSLTYSEPMSAAEVVLDMLSAGTSTA